MLCPHLDCELLEGWQVLAFTSLYRLVLSTEWVFGKAKVSHCILLS